MPATKLGWTAVYLAAAFVVTMATAIIVGVALQGGPSFAWIGILAMAFGLGAGVCAIVSLVKGERSWVVWLTLVPGLWSASLLIGEFGSALLGFTH